MRLTSVAEDKKAVRQAKKTARRVDRIQKEGKLEQTVTDADQLLEIRMEALNRISDDRIIARALAVLINPRYETGYRRYGYDQARKAIVCAAFPRITSEAAMEMLKKPILELDATPPFPPAEVQDSLFAFIRRMKDKECMMLLYRRETNGIGHVDADRKQVFAEDIAQLKELGVERLEIAKATPAAVFRCFVQELADESVIRYFAGNEFWIETNREFIPKDLVIRALETSDHRESALIRYQIVDGEVIRSECDLGKHDFVFDSEERERRDDDANRMLVWTHYRCSRCGKKHTVHDDGWGRITEYDN